MESFFVSVVKRFKQIAYVVKMQEKRAPFIQTNKILCQTPKLQMLPKGLEWLLWPMLVLHFFAFLWKKPMRK